MAKKKKAAASVAAGANPRVHFETTQGPFTVELFADVPTTTRNFVDLVSRKFYDGLIFHRYVPGFVIQGGDPTGTGGGGSDKTVPLEITAHKHVLGALGMARSNDPNSASCQFYVCLADQPSLDGSYAVFGQVVDGMDNVVKLRQGDKMTQVTLLKSGTP
jgi:cyclophilin family peptidyl-prolyl cis-trans isomerase